MPGGSRYPQRCFQGLADRDQKNGGDYITRLRQKTLYKNQRDSVQAGNYLQSKGRNRQGRWSGSGAAYNEVVIQPCGDKLNASPESMGSNRPFPSGRVAAAPSFSMLLDLAKGKRLTNPRFGGAESAKYGSFLSQMMEINYNGPQNTGPLAEARLGGLERSSLLHSVAVGGLSFDPTFASGYPGLQADPSLNNCMTFPLPAAPPFSTAYYGQDASWNAPAYPGYVLDPKRILLYRDTCLKSNGQGIGFWSRLAAPTFLDQPTYWRAVNAQPLNGFDWSDLGSISLTDDLVDAKTNFVIQAFGPWMTPQGTNLHPPEISCLNAANVKRVQSLENDYWDKFAWNATTGVGGVEPYGRVAGFQPGCARGQACRGFSKIN